MLCPESQYFTIHMHDIICKKLKHGEMANQLFDASSHWKNVAKKWISKSRESQKYRNF